MYNKTITGNTADTYYVRCRAYNSTSSVISSTQIVTVKKPVSLINSVTLNVPTSDLSIPEDYQFDMNCTPSTNNKPGINITFEYNTTTAGWIPLPTSGTENLTIDIPNPNVDVLSNIMYNHTVTVQTVGTYWIRCRAYNSTTSINSSTRRIDVRKIILSLNQTYPSYSIYTISNPLPVEVGTTFNINSTIRCDSQASSGSCGNVYCSVRYNSTGTTADTLISSTGGAVPLYVVGSATKTTYNFSGITPPSTTHKAEHGNTTLPQIKSGAEANYTQYGYLSSDDGWSWATNNQHGDTEWQQFRFKVDQTVISIKNLTVFYKGYGAVAFPAPTCNNLLDGVDLFIWNFTSNSWIYLGSISQLAQSITVTYASNFNDLINGSGFLYLLAEVPDSADKDCIKSVSTDFVKVDVESEQNTKGCGILNIGQECNLTWTVNATGGENTLWTIDTNCTSSSPKIVENNTPDAYVKIKPSAKLFVDKPSYKNCGVIHYRISIYDVSDNSVDSNITVRLIDPLGLIKSSFNASTTSGVYLGTYLLEPNAAIGDWIIKVSTCSISKKYFEVGQGNSELWKIDMNSPTKVKFSPGESISINLVIYNLKGDTTSNLLPSSSLTVSLDGNDITSSCSDLGDGAYRCTTSAPVSSGAHYININARAVGGTINITNSKSFFVE
jgi:hypothetical protein